MTDALSKAGFPGGDHRPTALKMKSGTPAEPPTASTSGMQTTTLVEKAVLEACQRHRARISRSCEVLADDMQQIVLEFEGGRSRR